MRELTEALSSLESYLMECYEVTLNEAMVLCSVGKDTISASLIVERTGMRASHTSKVIRSVEDKELLKRTLGDKDKRQMYFTLTDKGWNCLENIRQYGVDVPDFLLPLFKNTEE